MELPEDGVDCQVEMLQVEVEAEVEAAIEVEVEFVLVAAAVQRSGMAGLAGTVALGATVFRIWACLELGWLLVG